MDLADSLRGLTGRSSTVKKESKNSKGLDRIGKTVDG